MEFLTEKDLIQKARRGDQEAIDRLYEGTKNYAWFITKRYLRNDEDVADVLQESYISAFTKLNTFAEEKSFKTWLHTIVVNRCLNLLKKRKVIYISTDSVAELADNDEELLPVEWVERAEKRRDIMRIIDALPEGQRMAISLFYIEGLPLSEMAEVMGISEGTVKSHLARGRKAIKEAVLLEEKKGNKLYGIGFVPLLTQLFEKEAEAAVMPEEMSKIVWQGMQSGLATAGDPGAGQQGDSGTCGQNVHNSGTGGASGTAAKNAAKAATKVISKKAIIAAISVIGAAAIIAGVIFLPPLFNSPDPINTPGVSDTQTPSNTMDSTENTPDTVASDFEYHNDAALGGVVITKYIGKSDTVKVPEKIDDKPVVKIEDSTFQNCGSLKSITSLYLGGTFFQDVIVTKVSENNINIDRTDRGLFEGCDALTSLNIIIPDSVSTIDDYAFWGYYLLTDIIIADSVTHIGDWAFADCVALTTVTLPNSVESLDNDLFMGCTSLKTVTIPYHSGELKWITEDGGQSITERVLFEGCTSLENVTVIVPDNITKIDDNAFADFNELTDVIIPNSVTDIGYSLFSGCSSLKTVTMPYSGGGFNVDITYKADGGTDFGSKGLFDGCDSLTDLTVIVTDGVAKIDNYAFEGCSQLTNIIIPDSVTEIGYNAFLECSSLKNITIPDGVTSIGFMAFYMCSSLESIDIPDNVTSFTGYMSGLSTFGGCNSLESVKIGNGITTIDGSTFSGLVSLKTVKIGNSVTSIGDHAFEFCSALESVVIGNSVKTIGYCAFRGCESLASVNIPDGVTDIGIGAFESCKSLTSVTIPNSVTSVGEQAFNDIPDLTATYKGKTYESIVSFENEVNGEKRKHYDMSKEFYDATNN